MQNRIFIFLFVSFLFVPKSYAFWIWTPESGKWTNPKYEIKETPPAQLKYAKGFFDSKHYKKAIVEFEKLLSTYPKAKEAPDAQFYIGRSLEEQGNFFEAFQAYQKVIDKYATFSERSPEVVKKQFEIGDKLLEGEGKKSKFFNAVSGGSTEVIDVFRAVIKNMPYGSYAASAQYKIGLYLQEKQMFQESRDEFEKVINDYPESEWAKAAQYQIALVDSHRSSEAQYDQKVTQSAVAEFKDFIKEHPEAELTKKAQHQIQSLNEKEAENNFVVGNFYEKQKNFKAAKIYYTHIIDNYKNTEWAKKALVKIQEMEIKIK